jgi:dTDP-4-dehydrorhamnose reductase
MLGHKLCQVFREEFETAATFRCCPDLRRWHHVFDGVRVEPNVEADSFDGLVRVIDKVQPEAVVNCIGIVKQKDQAHDPIPCITINSLFPHRVKRACDQRGTRLIHISTDCVFSGGGGPYREDDPADPGDLYGRSKLLGEVDGENVLTVRTSIIGRELETHYGLVEWFLSNRGGSVKGFTRAIYSGFPTIVLARLLKYVIKSQPHISGMYHVGSNPISKYDLLALLRKAYSIRIDIEPDDNFVCNRSLDSTKFWTMVKSAPIPWPEMIAAMVKDGSMRREEA